MSRRSTRNSEISRRKVKHIFQLTEAQLGGFCYDKDQKLARIKNIICRYIEDCGRYNLVVKDIIREAIHFFDNRSSQFCHLHGNFARTYIGVLVLAAHLAQKYNVREEPDLIKKLLTRIFQYEGGFMRIMNVLDPLIFPDEVDPMLYPMSRRHDVINAASKEHLNVMEYFLREGGHVKVDVSFSQWELLSTPVRTPRRVTSSVSLVDAPVPACRGSSPLLLACQSLNPPAVLLLLRYGALPFRRPSFHESRALGWQFQHPLYHIIMKLNVVAAWSQQEGMDPVLHRQFKNAQAGQEADAMQCLGYFSRTMPLLPLSESEAKARSRDKEHVCFFYLNPHHLNVLPKQIWKLPAKLQHIARCRIRQLLPPSGIPRAISKLPLPPLLKSYLDLLYD